jgi:hypothetical protein
MKRLRRLRVVGGIGLSMFVSVGLLVAGVGPATAAGRAPAKVTIQTGKGLVAQKAVSVTTTVSVADHAPGAYIRCETSVGNGITASDGFLRVTFALACRWTDDGELAPEVVLTQITAGFLLGNSAVIYSRQCPGTGPTNTCGIQVPLTVLQAGIYRGVVGVEEFTSDGGYHRAGPWVTASTITIV